MSTSSFSAAVSAHFSILSPQKDQSARLSKQPLLAPCRRTPLE
jgi:hypothetical protein